MVERQYQTKIKAFQSDFGGEYQALTPLFKASGIIHRRACPQNGTSERKYQHIVNSGSTVMFHVFLPLRFWNFAFNYVVYNINHLTSHTHGKPPLSYGFKSKPNYNQLRVFGCMAFPFLRPYNSHKFSF